MSNKTMADLLKIQEAQRKDLAAGAHLAWLSQKEFELKVLEPYGSNYASASENIKDEIDKRRKVFFDEYGSEGKLAALMETRHTDERVKLAMRLHVSQSLGNNKSKDYGRGR